MKIIFKFRFWILLLLIVFYTQYYYPIKGLSDDQMSLLTMQMIINKKMSWLKSYEDVLVKEEKIDSALAAASGYGFYVVDPFFSFVSSTYSKIVGISIPKWHNLSVIIFLGLLYYCYRLSQLLFGKKYSFVFPLLIATNTFINVTIRNNIILHPLVLLCQFASIYYFIKLHQEPIKKNFILSILFLFLSLSNGTTYSLVVFLYLLLLLVIMYFDKYIVKKNQKTELNILSLKKYLVIFIVVPLFSTSFYIFNDLFLNLPLGYSIGQAFYYNESRFRPDYYHPNWFLRIEGSLVKMKEVFLGTKYWELYAPHTTMFSYRTPLLGVAASILFFLGLFYIFRKYNFRNIILTAFLFYTLLNIYGVGAPRIFISFVPFLLLISSGGFVFLVEMLGRMKFSLLPKLLIISLVFLGLLYDTYYFNRYFIVQSNSNYVIGAGIQEVKEYLGPIDSKKATVAMDNRYAHLYLNDVNEAPYYVFGYPQDKDVFENQVKSILSKYDEVTFIFPAEYQYYGNPGYLINAQGLKDFYHKYNYFQEVFPWLIEPSKVVYDYQGIPLHYLYKIKKGDRTLKKQRLIFNSGEAEKNIPFDGKIESVVTVGNIKKMVFDDSGSSYEILLNAYSSSRVLFKFEGISQYDFYINYFDDRFKEALYKRPSARSFDINFNIVKSGNDFAWVEPDLRPSENKPAQAPYLIEYYFDFPYKVLKADLKTDMRMFNTSREKDSIFQYFISNEKDFERYWKFYTLSDYLRRKKYTIMELKSDGSDTYTPGGEEITSYGDHWGLGRLSSYKILYPKVNKFIIAYQFYSGNSFIPTYMRTHLWTTGDSSFFKFTLDTSGYKKPEVKNGSLLKIESEKTNPDDKTVVDLYYY